jgi:hypothetical protein
MSTPERLPRIPEQDDDSSTQKEANLSTATRHQTRRTEKRFEIGFFIRKRVRRAVAYYRQLALARGRKYAAPPQQNLVAAPPSLREEGEETGSPTTMKAFAVRSGQGTGAPTGDTVDEPGVTDNAAIGEDDGGPIHGTSYEIGAFASTTTETTTDDD